MIKITIIIILIILLIITMYSYYYLSSKMINFERARLEYILQKETDVKIKENKVKVIADCSNKNEQYQMALTNINKILDVLNIKSENIESVNTKAENDKDIECLINQESINVKMLNEVPSEYIQQNKI